MTEHSQNRHHYPMHRMHEKTACGIVARRGFCELKCFVGECRKGKTDQETLKQLRELSEFLDSD